MWPTYVWIEMHACKTHMHILNKKSSYHISPDLPWYNRLNLSFRICPRWTQSSASKLPDHSLIHFVTRCSRSESTVCMYDLVYMYVSKYMCMYVCMCLYMKVCLHLWICVHTSSWFSVSYTPRGMKSRRWYWGGWWRTLWRVSRSTVVTTNKCTLHYTMHSVHSWRE